MTETWYCNICELPIAKGVGYITRGGGREHSKAKDCVDALRAENERLYSWDGLMSILDRVYPASVFDGSSGDTGPRIIVLLREIDQLRKS